MTGSGGIKVHVRDAMEAGLCVNGAREWARSNGLEWKSCVRDGINIEVMESMDCEMAHMVAAHVRARGTGTDG